LPLTGGVDQSLELTSRILNGWVRTRTWSSGWGAGLVTLSSISKSVMSYFVSDSRVVTHDLDTDSRCGMLSGVSTFFENFSHCMRRMFLSKTGRKGPVTRKRSGIMMKTLSFHASALCIASTHGPRWGSARPCPVLVSVENAQPTIWTQIYIKIREQGR
jgi:hypothetical protein